MLSGIRSWKKANEALRGESEDNMRLSAGRFPGNRLRPDALEVASPVSIVGLRAPCTLGKDVSPNEHVPAKHQRPPHFPGLSE